MNQTHPESTSRDRLPHPQSRASLCVTYQLTLPGLGSAETREIDQAVMTMIGDPSDDLKIFEEECRRQCEEDPLGFLALPYSANGDSGYREVWDYCKGFAANILGRNADAYDFFLRSWQIAESRGNTEWQAKSLSGVGAVLCDVGEHAEAFAVLEESMNLLVAINDVDGETGVLNNIGMVCLHMPGFAERAIDLFEESHSRYVGAGNKRNAALTLTNMAEARVSLAMALDDPQPRRVGRSDPRRHAERALETALRAAEEADELAMRRVAIRARLNGVHAAVIIDDIDLAEHLLATARSLRADYPSPKLDVAERSAHGHLLLCKGKHADAVTELQGALQDSIRFDAGEYRPGLYRQLVLAQEAEGDLAGALASFRVYHWEQTGLRDLAAERSAELLHARLAVEHAEGAAALSGRQVEPLTRENGELAGQPFRDALTELPNRRALMDRLKREFAVPVPTIGVALADLDFFKHVNDTYSHMVGDRVLQTVADAIRKALRSSDMPARWGGDEFAILLGGADGMELLRLCGEVRQTIAEQPWGEVGPFFRQTVSIGATLARPGDTAESMLRRADLLLDRAKSEGRAQVRADIFPVGG